MEKERLIELRNIIERIISSGINEEIVLDFNSIINEDNIPLVFKTSSLHPAAFVPVKKEIYINLQSIIVWVQNMAKAYTLYMDVENIELLKSYLVVYLFSHEVEHSRQYLYSEGLREPNFPFKKQMYRDIYRAMPHGPIVPRFYDLSMEAIRCRRYNRNSIHYILERNANIEGYDTAASVAYVAEEFNILNCMMTSRNAAMISGYSKNGNGSIKNTYRSLCIMGDYKKLEIPEMDLADKIREGVELNKEERGMALSLLKADMKFSK